MLFKLLFLFGDSSLHQFDRMVHKRSRTDLSGSFERPQLVCWWLVVLVGKFCHRAATAAFGTPSALLALVSITLSIAHRRYLLAGTRQSSALLAWGFCSARNWTNTLMKGGGPCFYLFFDERVKKTATLSSFKTVRVILHLGPPPRCCCCCCYPPPPPSLRGVSATRRRVVPPRVTSKYELKESSTVEAAGGIRVCVLLLATTLWTLLHHLTTLRGLIDEQVEFLSPPEARSCREVSVASYAVFLPFPRRNVS